ncbi:hypothetical protein ACVXHB_10520 [Escherichia coli]
MKADQRPDNKLRSLKNVDIILNAQTTEVKGDGSKVVSLEYRDRVSGDIHNIELAGIRPDWSAAEHQLARRRSRT